MHTPALDFINHQTSKQRAERRSVTSSSAMDAALSAIRESSREFAERVAADRAGHLASCFGTRKDQVRGFLDRPHMVAAALRYQFASSWDALTTDECLALIRRRLEFQRWAKADGNREYSANLLAAYRHAYVAVRVMRFRQRVRVALLAAE